MFVYIDESGNTGKNLKDKEQPFFHYMALVSLNDLDTDFDGKFKKILDENSISELHGVENFNLVEAISSELLEILSLNSVAMFHFCLEKEFFAYIHLFNTIFDNFENKGARKEFYHNRIKRLMLLTCFMRIVPESIAFTFYEECLFSGSKDKANNILVDTCNEILKRLHMIEVEVFRIVILDALTWARDNPSKLTTFQKRPKDRLIYLPQFPSILPLMNMLSEYSAKQNSSIQLIIHDEQNQIGKLFGRTHRVLSDPQNVNVFDLGADGMIKLEKIKNSSFKMSNSKNSYGIQIADFCLYICLHANKIEENKREFPNTIPLLEYLKSHTELYPLTKEDHSLELAGHLDCIFN